MIRDMERVTSKQSGGLQMEERPLPNNRIKPRDIDLEGGKNRGKNCGGGGNHP